MGTPSKGLGGPLNDTSIVTEVAEAKEHDDVDANTNNKNDSEGRGGAQYRTL